MLNLMWILFQYIMLVAIGLVATLLTIIALLFIALGLTGIVDFFRH